MKHLQGHGWAGFSTRRRRWSAIGLASAVALVGAPVLSGMPAAAAAPTVVQPDADTYVVQEMPGTAYGTATKLAAANWPSVPWHSEIYVRFTVPTPADGTAVRRAVVKLTFQKLDQQAASIELRKLTGAWSESTTYSDRPAAGAVVDTVQLAGQGTTSLSFDVTGAINGPGTYSFALTNPDAESNAVFNSREYGTNAPTLSVEYGDTLCGASFGPESAGESYQQALARIDGYYNGIELARVFYPGLPQAWPGKLDTGGRPMSVSFKAPPSEVLAGTHDAYLRNWFRTAPQGQDIYWTYFHEPEDDIKRGDFTAGQYRQAFQRVAGLAAEAGNPRLRATLILMGWTLESASGRNWRDYYPGRQYLDVFGWDIYNASESSGGYDTPQTMYSAAINVSRGENLPFAFPETGSAIASGDDGTRRAAWLRSAVSYLSTAGAQYVSYFDQNFTTQNGHDYRLRDEAGKAAWREFCS